MHRTPAAALLTLCLACSGAEPAPDPSAAAADEPAEGATSGAPEVSGEGEGTADGAEGEETADGAACAADTDCEMYTDCCACPRVPGALHRREADAARERCTRVRCAACGLPAPEGPARVARCRDARCVAEPAEDESACDSDDDCEIVSVCCACPPRNEAMHRDEAGAHRRMCAAADCEMCDAPTMPLPPQDAVCRRGACVAVPAG